MEGGELMTMDFLILRSDVSKGVDGETALLNILDLGPEFSLAHPVVKRSADAVFRGITRVFGGRGEVKYAHIDGAPELIEACDRHAIPHEQAAPYIHESNALIESWNKIELNGCRV